jgi:tetratricopeptide (TPR) repeat protein
VKQKTFHQALLELAHSPQKGVKYLADKRLSNQEKKIIEAHLLIRDNRNAEALELLLKISLLEHPFVEAEKKMMIGIAYLNLSRLNEAEPFLAESAKVMKNLSLDHFTFLAHFNLFVLSSNRGDLTGMEKALDELVSMPVLSKDHQKKLLRCQFMFHFESMQFEKAEEYLHLLKLRKKEMNENDRINLLISEFKFHVKLQNWIQCQVTLNEMKNHRKFQLKGNFKFMKILLDHLIKKTPIYCYDQDFLSTPLLYHQIKVIQFLEEGDKKKAEKHWKELSEFNPELYGDHFKYLGSRTLFSSCLEMHRPQVEIISQSMAQDQSSKINRLVLILNQSEVPLSKDRLFEMIWGHLPQDKIDQKKLVRLIYEAKTQHGAAIEYRKGTYFLPKKKIA